MDNISYADLWDIYYASQDDIAKEQNQSAVKNEIILTTAYDDVCNRRLSDVLRITQNSLMQNSDDCRTNYEQILRCLKTLRALYTTVLLAVLSGVALFVLCLILVSQGTSPGTSSPEKYPVMNSDLCDSLTPFSSRSWFMPIKADFILCDVPVKIREIHIEVIIYYATTPCLSILECISVIGSMFLGGDDSCKYSFFVDYNSNVYEVRGWLCPYVSGQLWVGVIVDYNTNFDQKLVDLVLKHFNTEIIGYAIKCDFISSSVINITSTIDI